jgi:opacity protein-like surface antigen
MIDKFIKGMAVAVFAAASLSAQAADMPLKAKPVETFNWAGCALGGSIGYAWGTRLRHRDRHSHWAAVGH